MVGIQEKPIKVLKPTFLTAVVMLSQIPLYLNVTVLATGILGTLGFFIILWQTLGYPFWYPYLFFGAVFLIATPLTVYFIGKRTYDKTDYKFYNNTLEYCEGFWTVEHKVIQYRNITEVYLRKSIVQRMYGVGSIYLAVPAVGAGNRRFSGVVIADIKNPDSVYQEIQNIVHR